MPVRLAHKGKKVSPYIVKRNYRIFIYLYIYIYTVKMCLQARVFSFEIKPSVCLYVQILSTLESEHRTRTAALMMVGVKRHPENI